ncbi:ribonuclease H-like domain-containing protein [Tanacetum coccineum]
MKKQTDVTPTTPSDISEFNTLNFFDTPYFPIKKPKKSLSDDDVETDSYGDKEISSAPGGINEDASDNYSTSLRDFNDATDRELVTSPYDDIIVEQSSTSEDNHNITNVNSDQPNLRKSSRTSKLPTKLSDFVLDDKDWVAAITTEMEAFNRNNIWVITDLPPNRKPIGCKWIYKIKYKSNREIKRYKARLVAKGYNQREGMDYDETFSLVVKMVTIKCLISMAVNQGWLLFQLDVNNDFLDGNLNEEVYMTLPPGYFSVNDNRVLKTDQGVCLSQRKYCMELLTEYGLLACKPYMTPIESKLVVTDKPLHKKDKVLSNITEYQKLLEKLIYLTHIRPDISYFVHCLSQFMHSPLQSHQKLAFRILKYLKGAPGKGVHITKGANLNLKAYVDSDWAKCKATRRSVTGSSAKAEYRALASVTCELMWLINLLRDLKIETENTVNVLCDNKVATQITANHVFHDTTKHFEIDLHFIRDKILEGVLKPIKIESENQIVDLLTKGLTADKHEFLLNRMSMLDVFKT